MQNFMSPIKTSFTTLFLKFIVHGSKWHAVILNNKNTLYYKLVVLKVQEKSLPGHAIIPSTYTLRVKKKGNDQMQAAE